MAFETFKGTLLAPIVTGTQTITGVPFQPEAVLFYTASLVGAAMTDVALLSFGAATGSASQWSIGNAENGSTSSNAGRVAVTNACITMPLNGNYAADAIANLTGFTSDGFTLNWSDAAANNNLVVHYFCLGGTDLTGAKCGAHTIVRTTAGTEATSGVGFAPDYVLFASPGVPNSTSIVDATLSVGMARRDPSIQRGAVTFFENDAAATMDCFVRRSNSKCLVLPDATSVIDGEADMSSFDSDGFTLNWTDPVAVASSRVFYYLALQGGQYEIGQAATPTVTGNDTINTSFQPRGMFLTWINRNAAVDTSITTAGDSGIGVATISSALARGSAVINETDADATSESWRHQDTNLSVDIVKGLRAAKAARATASVPSFAATSFTLNWTNVDASSYQYYYTVFGNNPAVESVIRAGVVMSPYIPSGRY